MAQACHSLEYELCTLLYKQRRIIKHRPCPPPPNPHLLCHTKFRRQNKNTKQQTSHLQPRAPEMRDRPRAACAASGDASTATNSPPSPSAPASLRRHARPGQVGSSIVVGKGGRWYERYTMSISHPCGPSVYTALRYISGLF